jgi:hypothetical protein
MPIADNMSVKATLTVVSAVAADKAGSERRTEGIDAKARFVCTSQFLKFGLRERQSALPQRKPAFSSKK